MDRPGPLYVRRNLTEASASAFSAWATAQGFSSLTPEHELHATIVYSRLPVCLAPRAGNITVKGGERTVAPLGDKGAIVLKFESPELADRWQGAKDQGASWDWDEYQPHVTITYAGAEVDVSTVEPFADDLEFGPEIHEPLNETWAEDKGLRAQAMRLDGISAMALNISSEAHPNKMPFRGVLTQLDEPSTLAPHGSEGKRVILTTAAAHKALPSLLGMAVNFTESYDGHDVTQKIGLITAATVEAGAIHVEGFIYARDHPKEAASIKKNKDVLGFSYELADIFASSMDDCWGITECTFTGAAILRKDKAAYRNTSLQASADEDTMTKEEISAAIAEGLGAALKPVSDELASIKAAHDATTKELADLKAAAAADAEKEAKTAAEKQAADIAAMQTELADLKAAAEKAKIAPERKTLAPQFSALLARADLAMPGEGEKLSIGAVDAALGKLNLTPVKRMEFKTELQRQGALA